ncbi:hypothetical protein FCM35_KLT21177 [Carex littledalei]|uniref:Uncharacterized protein n=1 Tax=Carex littledalei TaxID=544730 RepID=A0A833VTI5_9POAL|nr:hypothetical protein FCM35_KLT21177 [Carex littledalei]
MFSGSDQPPTVRSSRRRRRVHTGGSSIEGEPSPPSPRSDLSLLTLQMTISLYNSTTMNPSHRSRRRRSVPTGGTSTEGTPSPSSPPQSDATSARSLAAALWKMHLASDFHLQVELSDKYESKSVSFDLQTSRIVT